MPQAESNQAVATNALIICPNAGMLSELAPLLSHNLAGVQIQSVKEYPTAENLADLTSRMGVRLCFLDVESDSSRALALINELQIIDSSLQVVVTLSSNSPDLILRCLRQGASEFLMQPFSVDDLKPVLTRLSQLSPTITYGKGGKIICVAPTKGACGASTIAANLAYRRKTLGAGRLLLADLDPLTGTLSFLLKLKSNYSFLDAMNLASNLDGDLWRGVVSNVSGFDVVLAPENPMDTIQEMQDPAAVLEFTRQLYDLIIADCDNLFGEWGLTLARIADEVLLVTTNELPALQATQRVLAHLDRNRIERAKIRLIVNRYSRDVGLGKDAISTALHSDIFEIIPSDYDSVQRALVEGKPIPNTSPFGKSMLSLAEKLSGLPRKSSSPPTKKKAKKAASLTGIFSSIFSKATS
jgi:pilus assembly protein CpaE